MTFRIDSYREVGNGHFSMQGFLYSGAGYPSYRVWRGIVAERLAAGRGRGQDNILSQTGGIYCDGLMAV